MDEKRPKRRKDKDNPYTLSQKEDKLFLSFRDGQGVFREIEIDTAVFNAFDRFELDDLSILNEWDRHYEHSELFFARARRGGGRRNAALRAQRRGRSRRPRLFARANKIHANCGNGKM